MAQGFKFKPNVAKHSASGNKKGAPKPGAKVIKPKKAHAITALKIQKVHHNMPVRRLIFLQKIQGEHVKRTENMMMQKTRGMGEGQFRLLSADPKILAQAQAARAKKTQKQENEKKRPVKMAPKVADKHDMEF